MQTQSKTPHPLQRARTASDFSEVTSDSSSTASAGTGSYSDSPEAERRKRRNKFTGPPMHVVMLITELNMAIRETAATCNDFDTDLAVSISRTVASLQHCESMADCNEVVCRTFEVAERNLEKAMESVAHQMSVARRNCYRVMKSEEIQFVVELTELKDRLCDLSIQLLDHAENVMTTLKEPNLSRREDLRLVAHAQQSLCREQKIRSEIVSVEQEIVNRSSERKSKISFYSKRAAKHYDSYLHTRQSLRTIKKFVADLRRGNISHTHNKR